MGGERAEDGAWGGFWSGKTTTERVLGMVFCVVPAMSLPAFALFFGSRPVTLLSSFAIAAGSFLTLYQINVNACMAGESTTTSPFKITLGVLSKTHIWLLTSIAIALYCAAVIANRDRQSPQSPTAP